MTTAAFPALVARLNDASVTKRFEAYRDVAWDADDTRIDARDPRFRLPTTNPIGASEWYASLPPDTQSTLGLEWACQTLRFGVSFESCLSRGLLEFASVQPNRSPLYRYAMHELIEESHHSLMFQEVINRSGCEPHDVSKIESWFQRRVARWGATFPELFFLCVLSGEVFIDHDNRERLRDRDAMHPLFRRVLQIHVTEEARHVSFATGLLRERVPRLPAYQRWALGVALPPILDRGARIMLQPSPAIVRRFGIPKYVMKRAFGPESEHRRVVREAVAPIVALVQSSRASARAITSAP
jgi:hypothetical protein